MDGLGGGGGKGASDEAGVGCRDGAIGLFVEVGPEGALLGCQGRGREAEAGVQGGRCEVDCGFWGEASGRDEGVSCDGTRGKVDGMRTEMGDVFSVNADMARTDEVVKVGVLVGVDTRVCAVPEGRLVRLEDAKGGLCAEEALADCLRMHVGPELASDLQAERSGMQELAKPSHAIFPDAWGKAGDEAADREELDMSV